MGTECLKGSTEDRWVGGEDRSRAEEDLQLQEGVYGWNLVLLKLKSYNQYENEPMVLSEAWGDGFRIMDPLKFILSLEQMWQGHE